MPESILEAMQDSMPDKIQPFSSQSLQETFQKLTPQQKRNPLESFLPEGAKIP